MKLIMKKFWSITVLGLLVFNVSKIDSRGVPRASTEEIDIEKIDPEKIAIDNENWLGFVDFWIKGQ